MSLSGLPCSILGHHYWKIIKGNSLSQQQENVLIEIYFLRENLARQLNRPPFKVFGNQTIVELAKKMPKNEIQLSIFDDRVEITNPGGLPEGMSPELLGSLSIQRNPKIYQLLKDYASCCPTCNL